MEERGHRTWNAMVRCACSFLVAVLPLVGACPAPSGYPCTDTSIVGDRADFVAGPVDTDAYAISEIEDCEWEYPLYRALVTGKGSSSLYPPGDTARERAVEWFEARVEPLLDRWGVFWSEVRYQDHWCNGQQPAMAVYTWEWAAGDEIARTIAIELAAEDLQGEVAVMLENLPLCGGGR